MTDLGRPRPHADVVRHDDRATQPTAMEAGSTIAVRAWYSDIEKGYWVTMRPLGDRW